MAAARQVDLGIAGYSDPIEIGRGGFAVVYRAKQQAFDRDVAVKILSPIGLDPATRRRFQRECRAIGPLSWHPHILSVFDAGEADDGRLYMVMEYAPGGSLGDPLERGQSMTAHEVSAVGVAIAQALATAHDSGVLHCDVKPSNVLIAASGPALADFGIAAIQNATHSRTSTTASVAFAAPEILDAADPSPASDVYSLGATLYALLAGHPAFVERQGEPLVAVLKRVATAPVPQLNDVPGPLFDVIARAMAKEPSVRWESADEFADALQDAGDTADLEDTTPLASAEDLTTTRRRLRRDSDGRGASITAEEAKRTEELQTGQLGSSPSHGAAPRRKRRFLHGRTVAVMAAVVASIAATAAIVLAVGGGSEDSGTGSPSTTDPPRASSPTTVIRTTAPPTSSAALSSTPPIPVTDLSGTRNADGSVTLTWTENTPGAVYLIVLSDTDGNLIPLSFPDNHASGGSPETIQASIALSANCFAVQTVLDSVDFEAVPVSDRVCV